MADLYDLYEHLVTRGLAKELQSDRSSQSEIDAIDHSQSHEWLARHLAHEVELAIRSIRGDGAVSRQVRVVNHLLEELRRLVPDGPPEDESLDDPLRLLYSRYVGNPPPRTTLPFSRSTILTNAHGDPTFGHELLKELRTADEIDALISFVTVSGVRAIKPALEAFAQSGRPLRLLTTTYTGATDPEAIVDLARLPHVDVRISYDTRRTRLHAKAWLFNRKSGLHTAYIGSANLSNAALFHGNEWMMKAAAQDMGAVIDKFRGTFETLWNDGEFEAFDPYDPDHLRRLKAAISSERGGRKANRAFYAPPAFFTLRPYPYQAEILDRLVAERMEHGRRRNLVVAATGTGKTVIAAFDYARQIGSDGLRPRLLFLAHREEILHQARATFRNVLRDGAFGELLVRGHEPETYDHLFASIQSFNSRRLLERFGSDHWAYVVLDECHHAPADSYRAVMTGLSPAILLGLTATPERSDGRSLLPDFQGHIAAEVRLWQALERQLLAPFEYYGISDNTDLREVQWQRGAYSVDELSRIYSGNDRRAELVIEQTVKRVGKPLEMRALGFCVSVDHARFMARKFTEAGIPAIALHGASTPEERQQAPRDLELRKVNVIFTCDLFNEGVDLPYIDTLLFLRPTSSSTLFLQQLGRGLRLHEKKSNCLVLDFIGMHRQEFRFDAVLTALTGLPRGALEKATERDFPTLPHGCYVELDRVVREQVLGQLRRQLRGGRSKLVQELQQLMALERAPISIRRFLEATGRDLRDLYANGLSWNRLKRDAGLDAPPLGPEDEKLQSKLWQLLHLDDAEHLAALLNWLNTSELQAPTDPILQRRLLMLAYQLFAAPSEKFPGESFVALLRRNPSCVDDLKQLFAYLLEEVDLPRTHPLPHRDWPLTLHRRYSRREILTAVGGWNGSAKPTSREGVYRLAEENAELLFVTLDKSAQVFTPTTSYEDYAISEELFHWQTQGNVTPTTPTGRRYIEQECNGAAFYLFVRETTKDVFTFLGPVHYVQHQGSRPISVTWRLKTPIPGKWLQRFMRLVA